MGVEPARQPGEVPRERVSSKNGWGWGGVMREIGALVQGDGWYKELCLCFVKNPNCQMGLKIWWAGRNILLAC